VESEVSLYAVTDLHHLYSTERHKGCLCFGLRSYSQFIAVVLKHGVGLAFEIQLEGFTFEEVGLDRGFHPDVYSLLSA